MNDFPQLAVRTSSSKRALQWAFAWAFLFTAMHGYWYLGGRFGLGEGPNALPGTPASLVAWIWTILVLLMFALGLAVPIALLKETSRGMLRRVLVTLLWGGSLILLARGAAGLLDDAIRDFGLSSGGITGFSYQQILGTAHPSPYTLISSALIDGYFFLGGLLYGWAAWHCRVPPFSERFHTYGTEQHHRRSKPTRQRQ